MGTYPKQQTQVNALEIDFLQQCVGLFSLQRIINADTIAEIGVHDTITKKGQKKQLIRYVHVC